MIDLHLSTIGQEAAVLARKYGLGIEIADFGYAVNMDVNFPYWENLTHANLAGIERRIFHAPYNDLCPAAVDPLIMEVTKRRFEQAYHLTRLFAINKMVVHSGYIPNLFFKSLFTKQSVDFWRGFLLDKPSDFILLLENVMEEGPDMLLDIIEKTGDPRLQFCLDIGHAGGVFSVLPVLRWIETTAPYLSHVHIHNNYHSGDIHNPPGNGLIDMEAAINRIAELRPNATYTAETENLRSAVSWFETHGFLCP